MKSAMSLCREEITGKSGPHPPLWIFRRKPIFLVYRVYYRGMGIDPNVFEAKVPRMVHLPNKRPVDLVAYVYGTWYPMNAPERKDEMDETMEDPMLLEPDICCAEDTSEEDEIKVSEEKEKGMTKNDNAAPMFHGMNMDMYNVVNPGGEGNAKEAKLDLVVRKTPARQLSELKLRLDLLNELGTDGGFTEEELKDEKNKIFASLSRLIRGNRMKDRRRRGSMLFMTELQLGLLKNLKRSGVNKQECAELIKTMYLDLPPLSVEMEDNEPIYLMAKRKPAARLAEKAARLAKREEKKNKLAARMEETTENASQENGNNAKEPAESEWEVVDGMYEVNTSVAGMDMVA
eukprot:CCRYP_006175-RA/>CCRYP_006175-RA protein AED:0.14 eAED:0.15 QI:0/0.5/0.66/1/0/0/3/1736/345